MIDVNELSMEELKAKKKKAEYREARRRANKERRDRENHHKYMIGGVVHKYFPDCYQFEEAEWNRIIKRVFETREFREIVTEICRECGKKLQSELNGKPEQDRGQNGTQETEGSGGKNRGTENGRSEPQNDTRGQYEKQGQSGNYNGGDFQNSQGNGPRGNHGRHDGKNGQYGKPVCVHPTVTKGGRLG